MLLRWHDRLLIVGDDAGEEFSCERQILGLERGTHHAGEAKHGKLRVGPYGRDLGGRAMALRVEDGLQVRLVCGRIGRRRRRQDLKHGDLGGADVVGRRMRPLQVRQRGDRDQDGGERGDSSGHKRGPPQTKIINRHQGATATLHQPRGSDERGQRGFRARAAAIILLKP